jgi:hypothetical protein
MRSIAIAPLVRRAVLEDARYLARAIAARLMGKTVDQLRLAFQEEI